MDEYRHWRVIVHRKDGQKIVTDCHDERDARGRLAHIRDSKLVEEAWLESRPVGEWTREDGGGA